MRLKAFLSTTKFAFLIFYKINEKEFITLLFIFMHY